MEGVCMIDAVWEGFLEELVLDWTLEVSWKKGTFRTGGQRGSKEVSGFLYSGVIQPGSRAPCFQWPSC